MISVYAVCGYPAGSVGVSEWGAVKESLRHANSRVVSEKTLAAASRLTLHNVVVTPERRNVEAKVVPRIRLENGMKAAGTGGDFQLFPSGSRRVVW